MRILALETSMRGASVALLRSTSVPTGALDSNQTELDKNPTAAQRKQTGLEAHSQGSGHNATSLNPGCAIQLVAEFSPETIESSSQQPQKSSSQTLIPSIKRALAVADWTTQQIDLIAVTIGPGSFTGLRIGAVTAKVLAYAIESQIIGVNTLDVIAEQTRDYLQNQQSAASEPHISNVRCISVAIDAQRQQVFWRRFPLLRQGSAGLPKLEIINRESWMESIGTDEIATGPALKRLATKKGNTHAFRRAPEIVWYPRAEMVARIGLHQFAMFGPDDLWQLQPLYVRPSYAEEPLTL